MNPELTEGTYYREGTLCDAITKGGHLFCFVSFFLLNYQHRIRKYGITLFSLCHFKKKRQARMSTTCMHRWNYVSAIHKVKGPCTTAAPSHGNIYG